jgi:hypothetical protein
MQQEASEGASGDRSGDGVVEHRPQLREVVDTFGRRRLGDAASGVPAGKVAYCLPKSPENICVDRDAGGLRGAFAPEKIGGVGNKGNDPVRRNRDELGKEIVFTAKVRHRRNTAEAVAVARAPEAGRKHVMRQAANVKRRFTGTEPGYRPRKPASPPKLRRRRARRRNPRRLRRCRIHYQEKGHP